MRIFIPFTNLKSETFLAASNATLVPLIDNFAYGCYFKERWDEGLNFINLEHDVVPSRETLESLWMCPNQLCITGYIYRYKTVIHPEIVYLGCVKISKELIKSNPTLFDTPCDWTSCEGRITIATSETHCYHGSVIHLH